ncbi:hypothetical protein HPB48_018620 [Haemaphysalis longicornis]|uniref:Uncharacterized protein n=1 Tax=Haemaphysalis longicornis TaxID=44386 RepID=A0A9J6GEX5_HAELO|nr:hypothetical protein HPB48_018620 [Haemaphysalis longicornis]
MPSAFRLLVGVVAAALLVKSPKPFSTILGHLNVVKDQYSQELSKQPGKSKTEKLCSLVSNCFDMFKIVKDNAILSWPLKYASSLLSVLEDALAEVCVKLSTEDIAEVSTFHAALRRNTERLFQCLVPDVKAMVDFLHRRDEFFVVDTDRFIVPWQVVDAGRRGRDCTDGGEGAAEECPGQAAPCVPPGYREG